MYRIVETREDGEFQHIYRCEKNANWVFDQIKELCLNIKIVNENGDVIREDGTEIFEEKTHEVAFA